METSSHIDLQKLNRISQGQSFEYRDVVKEDFPTSKHAEGGAAFKEEVERGLYDKVVISNPSDAHMTYRKD